MDHSQRSKSKSDEGDGLVFTQATIDGPIEHKAIEEEDIDADGLADSLEEAIGTDILHPDSDLDGASDGEEVREGTNPNNAESTPEIDDEDGDGVSNTLEALMNTKINHPDSDLDGASDFEELVANTNALDASDKPEIEDDDKDLVSNTLEEIMGTDPTLADSDKDNLSDFEELQAGTSGIHPDSDLDGAADGEEAAAGTSPLDSSDVPEFEDLEGDGLSDTLEEILGTAKDLPDSDFDGASDYEELRAGTGALDPIETPEVEDDDNDKMSNRLEELIGTKKDHPDSDLDGASDFEEWRAGTSALDKGDTPIIEDQDKDGVSDMLEEIMGTSPTKYDTDGDTWSDGDELRANTNALDPEDRPLVTFVGEVSGTSCTTGCKIGVSFVAVAAVIGSIGAGFAAMKRRQKVDEEYEYDDEDNEGKPVQEDETVQVDV